MPLYEYQCEACGHRFEKIQKFSDPLEDRCPKCGGPVHKLMSSPAIQFKGSGWYITDYARKDTAPAKDSKGAAPDGKDAKTSEAKPDTKSDTKSDTAAKSEAAPAAAASKDSKA